MRKTKWTKPIIIAAIQEWDQRGLSLSRVSQEHRGLSSAALRYFGSWPQAVRAAGFEIRHYRHWSRNKVMEALRAHYPQSKSRTALWAKIPGLGCAAIRYFGSKTGALFDAGLSKKRPWSARRRLPEDILTAIRARHKQGLSLHTVWRDDVGLYVSAKKHFGNWSTALRAAGREADAPRRWTRETVVQALLAHHEAGLPMTRVAKDSPALYGAAVRQFDGWNKALLALGLPVVHRQHGTSSPARAAGRVRVTPHVRWSKERVIAAIRRWHASSASTGRCPGRLQSVAWRYFGGLGNALAAADLEPRLSRWTKTRIIEAIQDGYIRGLPIGSPGFRNRSFAATVRRHFGNWQAAVDAAGLASKVSWGMSKWTKHSVQAAIRSRAEAGLSLTSVWREDARLYDSAKRYFGTWRKAVCDTGWEAEHHAHPSPRTIAQHAIEV